MSDDVILKKQESLRVGEAGCDLFLTRKITLIYFKTLPSGFAA